jgi:hypothetical protein
MKERRSLEMSGKENNILEENVYSPHLNCMRKLRCNLTGNEIHFNCKASQLMVFRERIVV